MYRVPAASRWLRFGIFSLAAVVALLAVTTDPADARSRRKRYVKKYTAAQTYNPAYAAIVVDANTGATLHQSNPDSLRHPASLTKIMTLYMLFERLEAGKIKLGSTMPVSEHASEQAPTKLGLRPGQTLEVEDAIKALVTKSANDAAVVIAEALAGSEDEFALQMTRKARALGMNRTIYRNASGLPNDEQVTTAREQAMLGQAIQERFPRYYRYFSTSSFTYQGRAMRNHNKLLGRVHGVDGIKTGYTRASGFNLVTSVQRGDRHIIGVVLGGRSGGKRDAKMRDLIDSHIVEASLKRTKTRFAEAQEPTSLPAPSSAEAPVVVPVESAAKPKLAAARTVPVPAPVGAPMALVPVEATATIPSAKLGSNNPNKPIAVKTVVVKMAPKAAPVKTATAPAPRPQAAAPMPAPGARPGILGVLPAAVATAGNAIIPSAAASERMTPPTRATSRSGWAIQVGAFEEEGEAKQRLSSAQKAMKVKADPYTERTTKGEKTYFRARFAVNDKDQAESACKQLKLSDIVCMALKI